MSINNKHYMTMNHIAYSDRARLGLQQVMASGIWRADACEEFTRQAETRQAQTVLSYLQLVWLTSNIVLTYL